MTPHELNLFIRSYNERMQDENKEGLSLAYLTAYWGRVKRMPDLANILKQTETKRKQTDREMLSVVIKLNASLGGSRG